MILIGGSNVNFQLVKKSNNKHADGIQVICPPIELKVESSSILSYSVYNYHSVMIDDQHRLFGIGFNNNGEISRTLPKEKLEKFTEFSIKDNQNRLMILKAVHCGYSYTLYLVTDPDNQTRQQLAYSFSTKNPEFFDLTIPKILKV